MKRLWYSKIIPYLELFWNPILFLRHWRLWKVLVFQNNSIFGIILKKSIILVTLTVRTHGTRLLRSTERELAQTSRSDTDDGCPTNPWFVLRPTSRDVTLYMMMMNDKTYCRVNVSSSKMIMIDRRLFTPLHKTRSRSISGGSSLLSKRKNSSAWALSSTTGRWQW